MSTIIQSEGSNRTEANSSGQLVLSGQRQAIDIFSNSSEASESWMRGYYASTVPVYGE